MTQTVAGLFDNYEIAGKAVSDLENAGIPYDDISIVANNVDDNAFVEDERPSSDPSPSATATATGTGAGAGAILGGGAGLLTGLGLIAIPGLGPVVAAGWLAATATGAVTGAVAGGLIGALTSAGISKEHAHVYTEGVRRGGTLVSVRVPDDQIATAETILKQSGAVDPSIARADYIKAGWGGADGIAPLL
jgi:hypothetical protein